MPSRLMRPLRWNRDSSNSNVSSTDDNPPDARPPSGSALGRAAEVHPVQSALAALQVSRRAWGAPVVRNNARDLSVGDLKINPNEPDHRLMEIPIASNNYGSLPPLPADPRTRALRGRDYLEFLSTDNRLLPRFRGYIQSDRGMNNPHIRADGLDSLGERLRPITVQMYRDPALNRLVDNLSTQYVGMCIDRAEYFLCQMEDAALLARLNTGEIDERVLYNIGISFFKLEELRSAIRRRMIGRDQSQNVHAFLDAEFFLQDELALPVKHDTPHYSGQSFMTREMASEISSEVVERLKVDDGGNVMHFMSKWEPWRGYVKANLADELEENNGTFYKLLEAAENDRENPESVLSTFTAPDYKEYVDDISAARVRLEDAFIGQSAKTLLLNSRADYLAERNTLSAYFSEVH